MKRPPGFTTGGPLTPANVGGYRLQIEYYLKADIGTHIIAGPSSKVARRWAHAW